MAEKLMLRTAKHSDFDFLYELHRQTLKEYIEQTWGWDEDWQVEYFTVHFSLEGKSIIQLGGEDIGCFTVHNEAGAIFLAYIAILPEFQGKGIGSRLICGLLEQAASRQIPVRLRVLKANPARALYERLGFRVVEATETHYSMQAEPLDASR